MTEQERRDEILKVQGQIELLENLVDTAMTTDGAGVWVQLFIDKRRLAEQWKANLERLEIKN